MYCGECGMPQGIGKANAWKRNGTIASRYQPDLRGILYDVWGLQNLFSSLSERMGYDVSRLVIEGKRKDSKHYTRGLLLRMRETGAEPPRAEDFFRVMVANYAVPGFGRAKIIAYREGESVVLEMEDVYSVPMAQGQAAGVFEAVLDRRGDVTWEGDGMRALVTITAREGEPELEQRIESKVETAEPLSEAGDREYSLCPQCSAPAELAREFDWEVEKARITERRSGRRFIFDNARGITAVMEVLVDELGEDVEQALVEISRAYAREYYLSLEGGTGVEEEFARLSLWGWGLPSLAGGEKGAYALQVINPFYGPVMEGRLWGLMEAIGGSALVLGERRSEGSVAFLELLPA